MDAFIQYGIVAGVQAMQDSGLEVTEENATRIGAAIGSGIGGLGLIEETTVRWLTADRARSAHSSFLPQLLTWWPDI